MPNHLIRDIRYFERSDASATASFFPDYLGTGYPLVNRSEAVALGARFALKLAEHGFRMGAAHHVYLLLTASLPAGDARVCELGLDFWMQWVEVGQPVAEWGTMDGDNQSRQLVRLTSRALLALCHVHGLDGAVIPEVEAELLQHGPDLEIQRKVKETRSYRVVVSYQVRPHGKPSPLFVAYRDHKTGAGGKREILRLKNFEHVFPLVGSISVTGGVIRIRPRESARSEWATRGYQLPIEIPVGEIVTEQSSQLPLGSNAGGK